MKTYTAAERLPLDRLKHAPTNAHGLPPVMRDMRLESLFERETGESVIDGILSEQRGEKLKDVATS